MKRKTDKAIEDLQFVIDTYPEHVSALYQLGLAYLQKHRIFKAIQFFRKVIKFDPKDKGAAKKIEYLTDVP